MIEIEGINVDKLRLLLLLEHAMVQVCIHGIQLTLQFLDVSLVGADFSRKQRIDFYRLVTPRIPHDVSTPSHF